MLIGSLECGELHLELLIAMDGVCEACRDVFMAPLGTSLHTQDDADKVYLSACNFKLVDTSVLIIH